MEIPVPGREISESQEDSCLPRAAFYLKERISPAFPHKAVKRGLASPFRTAGIFNDLTEKKP
jgi:hypothetical protein